MNKKIIYSLFLTGVLAMLLSVCSMETTEVKRGDSWNLLSAVQIEKGLEVKIAGQNLLNNKGVKIEADSEENETYSVNKLKDGITEDVSLRWSSENNWENNEHWVKISFPESTTVGALRLYWERLNANDYAIEISQDGTEWKEAISKKESPKEKCETFIFEQEETVKYLRLHVKNVNKLEEDGSLYYQNVSLLEIEVFGEITEEFVVETPVVSAGVSRQLELPIAPEGYELKFLGAEHSALIDSEGNVSDTIADTDTGIGYALCKDGQRVDLPTMNLAIPASGKTQAVEEGSMQTGEESGLQTEETDFPVSLLTEDNPFMEWNADTKDTVNLSEQAEIIDLNVEEVSQANILIWISEEDELRNTAEIFADELSKQTGTNVRVQVFQEKNKNNEERTGFRSGDTESNSRSSQGQMDIYLILLPEDAKILGKEGFQLSIGTEQNNRITIEGKTKAAIRWGCVSVLDLLEVNENSLPKGTIRDYPSYEVRGFGIDVGRRPISLNMLYNIVEAMSREKMNTLLVHLNDNQIISQSEHDGTMESVRKLYAGFRLESDITNEAGAGITSTDLFYTKEEFRRFIEDAADYGVEVIPEIDTPGHSLALVKVFPHLGIQNVETADLLDVSKEEARKLVKNIWKEYLTAQKPGQAVFADCDVVHIGMDEYFGKPDAYVEYLTELAEYIRELAPEKRIRMWGSLTGMKCDYTEVSRDIEIQLWSTDWADPTEMYEAGFSIINSQNNHLYIVPGTGYDWLDTENLEQNWEPNIFETADRNWEIPSYSPQMLGACYMIWNDMIYMEGMEFTEEDLFARFQEPLEIIADKLWK